MKMATLLSVVLLVSSVANIHTDEEENVAEVYNTAHKLYSNDAGCDLTSPTNFYVLVKNSVLPEPDKNYKTYVPVNGTLLGGLRRLQKMNGSFSFHCTENDDYGPYLDCVNGLKANTTERTFWELLVEKPNKPIIPLPIGQFVRSECVGCYIPTENDKIILNYTHWSS
ncbi:uncharacterized protein KZ484_017344 [Pholidichthys leucotaenia]